MPNEIPISGLGSAGILLPTEQGEILTNGVLQANGTLSLAGDAKTTSKRKTTFPIWLGRPTAGPVGEGERKPVTGAEFGSKDLHVKKFASIVIFTEEQIEDLQDGNVNVLVDSGVRDAIAQSIDAHALGLENGANITSVFDSPLRSTAATPVEVDFSRADGLQRAVSQAMGVLEDNGYENEDQMGVVLGSGFKRLLRDAREAADGSTNPLYQNGQDPLYGLSRTTSTNLRRVNAAADAAPIAFVVYKPNIHVRLRTDVRVKPSSEASIEVPDPDGGPGATKVLHLYQDNLTAIRYEIRLGEMVHDVDRAVVPLVNAA